MKKVLTLSLLLFCAGLSLKAQEDDGSREADSLRHRFGRQEVKPATLRTTAYGDTLDTGNPAIKVVLYNNGTYRYVKDPAQHATDSVFTEYWDEKAVNPYREDPDPIPDRFSIWVVDSLDSYVCPNVTNPRSLFGYRRGRRHQGIDLPILPERRFPPRLTAR